jgi:hypothetical protein
MKLLDSTMMVASDLSTSRRLLLIRALHSTTLGAAVVAAVSCHGRANGVTAKIDAVTMAESFTPPRARECDSRDWNAPFLIDIWSRRKPQCRVSVTKNEKETELAKLAFYCELPGRWEVGEHVTITLAHATIQSSDSEIRLTATSGIVESRVDDDSSSSNVWLQIESPTGLRDPLSLVALQHGHEPSHASGLLRINDDFNPKSRGERSRYLWVDLNGDQVPESEVWEEAGGDDLRRLETWVNAGESWCISATKYWHDSLSPLYPEEHLTNQKHYFGEGVLGIESRLFNPPGVWTLH